MDGLLISAFNIRSPNLPDIRLIAESGFGTIAHYRGFQKQGVFEKLGFDIEFHVLQIALGKLPAISIDKLIKRDRAADFFKFARADSFFLQINEADRNIALFEEADRLLGVFAFFGAENLYQLFITANFN